MAEMIEEVTDALIAQWRIGAHPATKPDVPYWRDMARAAVAVTTAKIEAATAAERERCAALIEKTEMYGDTPEHPGVSYTSPSWRKQIAAAIRAHSCE